VIVITAWASFRQATDNLILKSLSRACAPQLGTKLGLAVALEQLKPANCPYLSPAPVPSPRQNTLNAGNAWYRGRWSCGVDSPCRLDGKMQHFGKCPKEADWASRYTKTAVWLVRGTSTARPYSKRKTTQSIRSPNPHIRDFEDKRSLLCYKHGD